MLRNRGVVLSVVGALYGLSAMGDQMALIALTLRLHDQGRSGLAISALVIAGVLPLVVVGPLAAPLVDRVESGRLIVVVTALQAVLGLGLAFVTDVMVCIGLLALLGAGLAVVSPALLLLVPYGVLVTAHTVGMLLTSALIAPRIPVTWQPRVLAGSGVLMGVALAVSSGVPVFAVTLGAFVLTGAANSLQALAIRNLIHARVPADVRGRAFASSGAALNGANLAGTALGGPAVSLLGGAGALALAGIGTLVVSVAGAPVLLRGQSDAQRTPTEVGRTSTEAGRTSTTDTDRPVGPARD
ncbi:hypothetical protein [Streptomyces sp. NPDC047985]|uniref:hypothetical protein n=1 Tax=Streptomyces sp. NPDC047985 TaxID=3155384 RepID=UPI00343DBC89